MAAPQAETSFRRIMDALKLGKERVSAVILSIEEYRELLERVEDAEDLKTLRAMRKRPLRFRKLDDFLKDSAGV